MYLKKSCVLALFFVVLLLPVISQDTTPYYRYADFLMAPEEGMDIGLNGYLNPAILSYSNAFDALFAFSFSDLNQAAADRFGIFTAVPHFGFGMFNSQVSPNVWENRYRISTAMGSRLASFGFGWEWSNLSQSAGDPDNLLIFGLLLRPLPHISIGAVENVNQGFTDSETVFSLNIRPLGNEFLTLFSDYAFMNPVLIDDLWNKSNISAGLVVSPIDGVYLSARYLPKTARFALGLKISSGNAAVATQFQFNSSLQAANTTAISVGFTEKSFVNTLFTANSKYLEITLTGTVRHRVSMFDARSQSLLELLRTINEAGSDPAVAGIALNMSGFSADPSIIWEIRSKLKEFKSKGKHVIAYIDRVDVDQYYLASVADRILLDPLGTMVISGFIKESSHFRQTIEKLGIGYEDFRINTFKSGRESLSRDSMSAAEKEQWQAILKLKYELYRDEITQARNLPQGRFDEVMNKAVMLVPEKAAGFGLVDGIKRWDAAADTAREIENRSITMIRPNELEIRNRPYETAWGEAPRIAVIYAIGACDLDSGMRARSLQKDILAAARNPFVRAVVIRVESPGGDPLASDYITEAMRECRKAKPVVVSQGYVAASGGYWISMAGDAIVSTPMTLTGSIGILSGWFYDKGFKANIGLTTDAVKIGDHADMFSGIPIPFLNVTLSDRTLTPEERAIMDERLKNLYGIFIEKVAASRNMTREKADEIAQGRIWAGPDAKNAGLVDEIGGLERAIQMAKEKAGIPADSAITCVEYPIVSFFDAFSGLVSATVKGAIRAESPVDPLIEYVNLMLKYNGQMLLLPDLTVLEELSRY